MTTTTTDVDIAVPVVRRDRFGRTHALGLTIGLFGLLLVGYVAPNLTDEQRTMAFEPPPDPLSWTFTPLVPVTVIGLVFLVAAVVCFVPGVSTRWRTALLTTSGILFLPLVVVVALGLSELSSTNVTTLLVESLKLGTPIALGSMAGLWSERSGVVNIGIEGMMLGSAGVGFMVYAVAGDGRSVVWLWISVGVAVLGGGLIAALHAMMSVTFRVDQIVSGVVVNLLALGVTGFLLTEVINKSGVTRGEKTGDIAVPLLSSVPVFGEQVFTRQPIFLAMLVLVTGSWWVLFKTRFGLRVRAVGENPEAAESVGIDVIRIRYVAVIVGGLIAGLGGASFSLESQAGFQANITSGAGFIALAALIFGKWRPWPAFAGAMLFGFTRALDGRMQLLDVTVGDFTIPSEFWQSLPFVVTVIIVAGLIGRATPPASIGRPFERSR